MLKVCTCITATTAMALRRGGRKNVRARILGTLLRNSPSSKQLHKPDHDNDNINGHLDLKRREFCQVPHLDTEPQTTDCWKKKQPLPGERSFYWLSSVISHETLYTQTTKPDSASRFHIYNIYAHKYLYICAYTYICMSVTIKKKLSILKRKGRAQFEKISGTGQRADGKCYDSIANKLKSSSRTALHGSMVQSDNVTDTNVSRSQVVLELRTHGSSPPSPPVQIGYHPLP